MQAWFVVLPKKTLGSLCSLHDLSLSHEVEAVSTYWGKHSHWTVALIFQQTLAHQDRLASCPCGVWLYSFPMQWCCTITSKGHPQNYNINRLKPHLNDHISGFFGKIKATMGSLTMVV